MIDPEKFNSLINRVADAAYLYGVHEIAANLSTLTTAKRALYDYVVFNQGSESADRIRRDFNLNDGDPDVK